MRPISKPVSAVSIGRASQLSGVSARKIKQLVRDEIILAFVDRDGCIYISSALIPKLAELVEPTVSDHRFSHIDGIETNRSRSIQ